MESWWLPAALGVALLAAVPVHQYNRMVTLRNRCKESWSNVDTELKRRYDLVPNLVATVKGYAAHEQAVFAEVANARARAVASTGRPAAQAADENALVRALSHIFAVAEAYPALKASANFLELQRELALTEDRIQAARRFYNANVRDYRNQTTQVPGVWFASAFGMRPIDFFEVASPQFRVPPNVSVRAAAPASSSHPAPGTNSAPTHWRAP